MTQVLAQPPFSHTPHPLFFISLVRGATEARLCVFQLCVCAKIAAAAVGIAP
jgi:hypothetical protein